MNHSNNDILVTYANGDTSCSSATAQLNDFLRAIVLPDRNLIDDLVSINPIVDLGYDILISSEGGWILKDDLKVMPINRSDSKWMVDLKRLQCLSVSSSFENIKRKVIQLHERMGHAAPQVMSQALEYGSWSGTDVTSDQVKEVFKDYSCIVCAMCKRNRQPIPPSITDPMTTKIGELISGDIVGPISPTNKAGHKYFYLFVDRRTSFLHAFTAPTKDGFITALRTVYDFYLSHGHQMLGFRSDSENIMVYGDIPAFLDSKGVHQYHSLPYTHNQNLVERHVQTVTKMLSAMMHTQTMLDASWWDYALYHLIELKNNSPNKKTQGCTPLAMVKKKNPVDLNRAFLFAFGSPVLVKTPEQEKTWKFDARHDLGIYVGQGEDIVRGGLIYFPSNGSITNRSNLIQLDITEQAFHKYSNIKQSVRGDTQSVDELVIEIPQVLNEQTDIAENRPQTEPAEKLIPTTEQIDTTENRSQTEPAEPLKPIKLSNRQIKKILRSVTTRSIKKLSALSLQALAVRLDELTLALEGEEKVHWLAALRFEVESLLTVTKTLLPETPDPSKPYDLIHSTIVLKKKMKNINLVDKYKARICGCGNQLIAKQDYSNPTYSPTVSMLVHSALLQLSIHDQHYSATFDTVAAYLYQEYPHTLKPLYLKLPNKVATACGLDPKQTYRVKKYLYGLPDAGRAYYLAYSQHLEANGYKKSASDPCLFIKTDPSRNMRTYVWSHVDDMFVSSTHKEEIEHFESILSSKFSVTANYDITSHLGINLDKRQDGSLKLSQPKLLDQILKENPTTSETKYPSKPPKPERESPPIDQSKYLHLLGQLMYFANSRPDLLTSLSYAACKSKEPTQDDFDNLLQIVAYLRSTQDHGLIIHPKDKDSISDKLVMTCYVDAAYMSHNDAASHTGYTIAIGSPEPKSFFYSKSMKQKLTATSSTHAEIRALYDLTLNIIFLINLFDEIERPIDLPAIVFEDNQPAIDLTMNPTVRISKSKHFLMTIKFLREQVELGLIQIKKIPTDENISNVLTKDCQRT